MVAFGGFVKPNIYDIFGDFNLDDVTESEKEWMTASNLFRLFRIYKEQSASDETFDNFIFWGEMLLSDFDEIDKYMVDARQIFPGTLRCRHQDGAHRSRRHELP